jgi:hypothetical protein
VQSLGSPVVHVLARIAGRGVSEHRGHRHSLHGVISTNRQGPGTWPGVRPPTVVNHSPDVTISLKKKMAHPKEGLHRYMYARSHPI